MRNRNIIAAVLLTLLFGKTVFGQSSVNSVGMEFILIPSGSMTVGEFRPPYPVPEDTVKGVKRPLMMYMGEGRGYNAREFALAKEMATEAVRPGFVVHLKKAFYIGKFEVTQGEWKKVMGDNPSTFKSDSSDRMPVENITWQDAQRFVSALNKLEKKNKYRLPTEFEWEYAARAGAKGDISWDEITKTANLNKKTTRPVGKMWPNAFGVYDMLGNVWEWVSDVYNEKLFADPVPPKHGTVHVLKGASFVGDVKNATYMTHAAGPGNGWDVGFRIVMEK